MAVTHSDISSRVLHFVQHLVREVESAELHQDPSERLSELLHSGEILYGHLERLASSGMMSAAIPELIREILLIVRDTMCNQFTASTSHGIAVQVTGRRGRPRFLIAEDPLCYLLGHGFTVPIISRMMGVSVSTIRRRMADLDIRISDMYATISDNDLDEKVREVKEYYPNHGSRMLQGQLKSQGIRVQRHRIRESLRRIDPLGCTLRWFNTVQRRNYSVPHSQWLWHIDGNHKLIRWRLVLHGGIDGYSRLVVFLHCSTDNRASTVLDLFVKATSKFGIPSRVRSDKGSENRLVALYMLSQLGTNRNSMLTGRSVHNQRIERLWRDVWQGVTSVYYHLFHFMEDEGLLDPIDEVHLYCLHTIFVPRINQHLAVWQGSWNSHPLSSCSNRSPMQLWIAGQPVQWMPHQIEVDLVDPNYGISWNDPVPLDDNTEVQVPEVGFSLREDQLQELHQVLHMDPLSDDGNYGINHYCELLNYIIATSL